MPVFAPAFFAERRQGRRRCSLEGYVTDLMHAADGDAYQRQGEADHDHHGGPGDQVEGALVSPDSRNCSFIVPGAQHNLTIRPEDNDPFFWWKTAPGVYALVIDWVRSVTQRY